MEFTIKQNQQYIDRLNYRRGLIKASRLDQYSYYKNNPEYVLTKYGIALDWNTLEIAIVAIPSKNWGANSWSFLPDYFSEDKNKPFTLPDDPDSAEILSQELLNNAELLFKRFGSIHSDELRHPDLWQNLFPKSLQYA